MCFWYIDDPGTHIPDPDGQLHVYFLPIGQGDATVIQCPGGSLNLYDWGSSNSRGERFWAGPELRDYLAGRIGDIRSVLVTHHHWDHYSLLPDTFPSEAELSGLEHIYIACTEDNMAATMRDWVDDINGRSKLRLFNGGNHCGTNGVDCGTLDFCPGDNVDTFVMAANMDGGCPGGGNLNIDSVVTKVSYGGLSILLCGDFEDPTSGAGSDGPQRQMVEYYGSELVTPVYHAAHHGATNLANKLVWLEGVAPDALIGTGDAWYQYGHPRCLMIDRLLDDVGSLCQPGSSCPAGSDTQTTYTCGISSSEFDTRTGNTHAIYTTTPDQSNMNLIDVASTGSSWRITYESMAQKKPTWKEEQMAELPNGEYDD